MLVLIFYLEGKNHEARAHVEPQQAVRPILLFLKVRSVSGQKQASAEQLA